MIVESAILGGSLMVSAMILFAGLANQHTQVVYVSATDEELLLEVVKRISKKVNTLAEDVSHIAARSDGARQDAGSKQSEGSAPGVQPDSGQSV